MHPMAPRRGFMNRRLLFTGAAICALVAVFVAVAGVGGNAARASSGTLHCPDVAEHLPAIPAPLASEIGIHRIRHVIIIMQEHRSFDSYFGTFPGADGIPTSQG